MKIARLCLLVLGCQGEKAAPPPPPASSITPQECRIFLVKARATMQELGSRVSVPYTQQMEETAIKDCEADVTAGKPMAFGRCILDAKNEDEVHECFPTYDRLKGRKTP